jgi:xanthine dehydrogenase accessory factor
MRELLAELTNALGRRLPCVYCAVVETRGSTPQKAGAAMLVYPNGTQAGTLGGGCVEAEVKRRALCGLNDAGRPEVLTFCLDDDWVGRRPHLRRPHDHPGPSLTASGARRLAASRSISRTPARLADRGDGFTEAVVIGEAAGLPVGDRYLSDATRPGDPLHTRRRPARRRRWRPTSRR